MWHKSVAISGHSAPVYACKAQGDWIYSSAGDRFITRWHTKTGEQDAFAVRLDAAAYTLGWAGSPGFLVIGCTNGTIIAVDPETKKLVWEHNFLGKALFSCVDCPTEQFLVFGDLEGHLLVVDYSGNLLTTFHLDCGKIRQLKWFGQHLFAACQDGNWRTFDLPTFNEVQTVDAHPGGVTALHYFENDHTLLTGGKDAYLRLWDTFTGQKLMELPAHYQTIYGIETIAQGNGIVTVSMDKTIKIWNPDTWKVEERIEFRHGGHNRSVNGCFSLEKGGFGTFGDDKLILLWDEAPVDNRR
jgi:WD repeat-containing protein 61